jgi:hypothetical protein
MLDTDIERLLEIILGIIVRQDNQAQQEGQAA